MIRVAILGSTGSIGKQALSVIEANPEIFQVSVLSANRNVQLLSEQAKKFRPDKVVISDETVDSNQFKKLCFEFSCFQGAESISSSAFYEKTDLVLNALVGFAGLLPTLAAIKAGKNIALANKETLVAGGKLVMECAKFHNVNIFPVDSEHSAIAQCLSGENASGVKRLILTASGGPFRGKKKDQLQQVSVEECLKHPNWAMGPKITVDSATLINKGLEVIEARWLFDVGYDKIDVIVHPQSIIHSMVEFIDGSVKAQLGRPDMRLPIQYAMNPKGRLAASFDNLDFNKMSSLTFERPDYETFSGLSLAYQAAKIGGTATCVLNAANEVAVHEFLNRRIRFLQIVDLIATVLLEHKPIQEPTLEDLVSTDIWARNLTQELCKGTV